MYKLYTSPEVLKYTGEPIMESMEKMIQAIQERIDNYRKYGYGRWAAFLKKDSTFIGWAGLAYLPEFDEIDLGYRFMPEYWGLGIATEASQAVLTYSFETLKLERIVAIAMKEHKASIRVMQKIGMKFEKYAPYEIGSKDATWYWCDKEMIDKH